jgi:hypothetical protein
MHFGGPLSNREKCIQGQAAASAFESVIHAQVL